MATLIDQRALSMCCGRRDRPGCAMLSAPAAPLTAPAPAAAAGLSGGTELSAAATAAASTDDTGSEPAGMSGSPSGATSSAASAGAPPFDRRRLSRLGTSRALGTPFLNWGRMLSAARSVSRLITRYTTARMTNASAMTKITRNSR